MQGHTNRATINQRRPLTDNMRGCLKTLKAAGMLYPASLPAATKNALRALMDRGFASWDNEAQSYIITDAGISEAADPAPFTHAELVEFDRLTERTASRDQVERIDARLKLRRFVELHGKPKCDAMYAELNRRQQRRK